MIAPEPPEPLARSTSPAKVLDQLDFFREQYRMGVMELSAFNHILKLFQFHDEAGVLWTPGAQSGGWYRLLGGRWMPGEPPARLVMPALPLELAPDTEAPALPPLPRPAPAGKVCPRCGTANAGKKFCTSCGAKL